MRSLKSIINNVDDFECTGGVSLDEIADAEKKLNLKFADDYKEYLCKYGTGFFDNFEITGLNISKRLNVVDVTLREKELKELPKDMYVIENLGIEGIFIYQKSNGEIFEVNAQGEAKKIFNNFSDYLLSNL